MKKSLILTTLVLATTLVARHRYQHRQDGLAPNFREFINGIPTIRPDLKLVIASVDMVQSVSAESPKVAWGVDWGTTKAAVSAPTRAHYAVDLSGGQPVDFRIDPERRTFTAVFPDPAVQSVEIFLQNSSAIVEPGWGRFKAFSGQTLVESLDRRLYAAALKAASAETALRPVRAAARPGLEKLVGDYLSAAGARQARVDVLFRSESFRPSEKAL